MAIADAAGFPVSAHIDSASPHEVKLVEQTIDSGFTQYAPDRIIGDKAYDSDGLDERLLDERGIEYSGSNAVTVSSPGFDGASTLENVTVTVTIPTTGNLIIPSELLGEMDIQASVTMRKEYQNLDI